MLLVIKILGLSIKVRSILAPQDLGLLDKPCLTDWEIIIVLVGPESILWEMEVGRVVGPRNGRPEGQAEGQGKQEEEENSKNKSGGKHYFRSQGLLGPLFMRRS